MLPVARLWAGVSNSPIHQCQSWRLNQNLKGKDWGISPCGFRLERRKPQIGKVGVATEGGPIRTYQNVASDQPTVSRPVAFRCIHFIHSFNGAVLALVSVAGWSLASPGPTSSNGSTPMDCRSGLLWWDCGGTLGVARVPPPWRGQVPRAQSRPRWISESF